MKPHVRLAVVIPVGPTCRLDYIADTLDSIYRYTTPDRKIVLIDDSQQGKARQIRASHPEIDVVETTQNNGIMGGLYITLCMAFTHVLANYSFDALLRLDTDALVTGPVPEDDAIRLFTTSPEIGIAGQFRYDYNGNPSDVSWARRQTLKYCRSVRSLVRRPRLALRLRELYRRAGRNGYEAGDYVFGGAYFMSEPCLLALQRDSLLPDHLLRPAYMQEDHLFGLLVKSAGLELGDLATGDKPFACAWRALPDSPERLNAIGKKIVHSTRRWEEWDEDQIRKYYRGVRVAGGPTPGAT